MHNRKIIQSVAIGRIDCVSNFSTITI